MRSKRRNVLTMLGLAAARAPALATDDMALTEFDGERISLRQQKYDPERMGIALERLGAEVRKGYGGCSISRFHIGSELIGDGWLTQTLTIDVEVAHPDKPELWANPEASCIDQCEV